MIKQVPSFGQFAVISTKAGINLCITVFVHIIIIIIKFISNLKKSVNKK